MKLRPRPKGFIILAGDDVLRNDMSLRAKGLLAYLLALRDTQHVTLTAIAMELREDLERVRYAARELHAFGYIDDFDEVAE